jgi:protein TonB
MAPLLATLGIHGVLAAGLDAAQDYIESRPPPKAVVTLEILEQAPPPPPVVEPPPPPPPPAPVAPPPVPQKRIAEVMKDPPPPPPDEAPPPPQADPEPPAPGPADDAAEPFVYHMDGPTVGEGMPVASGARPTGNLYGRKTGKGDQGTGGGGGPPDSKGTGAVSVAAVKVMPKPIGNYARLTKEMGEYPPEAAKNGIEGAVIVKILVDDTGRVTEAKLVKGVGYGLDQKALELARKLRFEPGRDTADRPVSVRISWTFHFTLPE